MKKGSFIVLTIFLLIGFTSGSPVDSTVANTEDLFRQLNLIDSMNNALNFKTGKILLNGGMIELNVPSGYKFLNAEQSKYVANKIWDNPERDDILGMIFPENADLFSDSSYTFIISYEEIGYVKDEDADDINYDDLLKNIKEEQKTTNEERVKNGYDAIDFVGWASKPFYDKTNKVLHWAKELKFGNDEVNTLNYEVRLLGRKGVLSLNAVATMKELKLVQDDIDDILKIASFTEGNMYKDFDEGNDHIAEWTIGGLVAGKILAKTGLIALLLKNIKLIFLGIVGLGGAVWRRLSGKKTSTASNTGSNEPEPEPESGSEA